MFLIREVMHCKPGQVRGMVDRFKGVAKVMKRLGYTPFRILTDVSGERFWTVVAETEIESMAAFLEMEERVMADDESRQVFAGYHELVLDGYREIYRVEG